MTREEAVARIKDHIEIHRYHERNAVKIFEALDMAIKALEQPEPCEDAVSRQATIDDFYKYPNMTWTTLDVLEHINALPPAQPEIIYCEECKHHHYERGDIPYCDRIDYGYGWKDDDFCSKAERRVND